MPELEPKEIQFDTSKLDAVALPQDTLDTETE